ncbi:MAG: hypothetical protein ACT4RN_08525 [Pseudonocardia sp.]
MPDKKAPEEQYASATHVTGPFELGLDADGFSRADIEFHGVDHSGASYEARVFLNRPDATVDTAATPEEGYAGSFHVFGHGGCFGDDEGHCEVAARRAYDPRPEHPLAKAKKVVIATDAVRRALGRDGGLTVTVVPVVTSLTERCATEDVFRVDHVDVVAYD